MPYGTSGSCMWIWGWGTLCGQLADMAECDQYNPRSLWRAVLLAASIIFHTAHKHQKPRSSFFQQQQLCYVVVQIDNDICCAVLSTCYKLVAVSTIGPESTCTHLKQSDCVRLTPDLTGTSFSENNEMSHTVRTVRKSTTHALPCMQRGHTSRPVLPHQTICPLHQLRVLLQQLLGVWHEIDNRPAAAAAAAGTLCHGGFPHMSVSCCFPRACDSAC